MKPIKQVFVAHEGSPPHYSYRGVTPEIGQELDGETVLAIETHFDRPTDSVVVVIGDLKGTK
jgi:hypothetical protein